MRKVCVVITARPSYSRIKTALEEIRKNEKLILQIVVTSSGVLNKYGNVVKLLESDNFFVDAKVFNLVEGETLLTSAKTTGLAIIELSSIFNQLKPDIVVTIADRYETIATAISAAFLNIPLVHIQGGEVTGNIDDKVRHAISKLSDYHMVSSEQAKSRLINMGEDSLTIFNTGCPSIDIVKKVISDESTFFDPIEKYSGVGNLLSDRKDYIIVLQHPVTTEYGNESNQIEKTLRSISNLDIQCYWFWPNVDAGSDETSKTIRRFRELENPKNIYFFKNLSPEDFIRLLKSSKCIVGNSSVAIREASYLGTPSINIGTRQHGRDFADNVISVDYDQLQISEAIKKVLSGTFLTTPSTLYGFGDAGEKISKILENIDLKFTKNQ